MCDGSPECTGARWSDVVDVVALGHAHQTDLAVLDLELREGLAAHGDAPVRAGEVEERGGDEADHDGVREAAATRSPPWRSPISWTASTMRFWASVSRSPLGQMAWAGSSL